MSSNSSTKIERDVAVGRHVTTGGNATVRGSVTVGHDLKVEGWLEAPNLRTVNRGIYRSPEALEEYNPYPENGWWAIVGDSLPGPIYVAIDGKWVPTGKTGGQVSAPLGELNAGLDSLKEALTEVQDQSKALDNRTKEVERLASIYETRLPIFESRYQGVRFLNLNAMLGTYAPVKNAAEGIARVPEDFRIPGLVLTLVVRGDVTGVKWETWQRTAVSTDIAWTDMAGWSRAYGEEYESLVRAIASLRGHCLITSIGLDSTEDGSLRIKTDYINSDGTGGSDGFTIPVADAQRSGLLTPEMLAKIERASKTNIEEATREELDEIIRTTEGEEERPQTTVCVPSLAEELDRVILNTLPGDVIPPDIVVAAMSKSEIDAVTP